MTRVGQTAGIECIHSTPLMEGGMKMERFLTVAVGALVLGA
jgi:hypothetical protein